MAPPSHAPSRGRSRGLTALLVALALVGSASVASAAPKRAVPDYDGRAEAPATAGEVLLWVPRTLLSPAYLASEFLLRRPLGLLVTEMERAGLLDGVFADSDFAVLPTFVVDFGFRASGGVYVSWDDAGFEGHEFRLRAAWGGPGWWRVTFKERSSPWAAGAGCGASRRPPSLGAVRSSAP